MIKWGYQVRSVKCLNAETECKQACIGHTRDRSLEISPSLNRYVKSKARHKCFLSHYYSTWRFQLTQKERNKQHIHFFVDMKNTEHKEAKWFTDDMNVEMGSTNESMLVAQLCLTLHDPIDCSPWGSSVHGILQARILECVTVSSSRGSSQPKDQTQASYVAGRLFTFWATRGVTRHLLKNRINDFKVRQKQKSTVSLYRSRQSWKKGNSNDDTELHHRTWVHLTGKVQQL